MKYTNVNNIPLPLAVFLATDHYDYVPNTVSATTLLKPIRQIILSQRLEMSVQEVDISSLVNSRMGTAIHSAIEYAWLNPTKALKSLGYDDKTIERIKVNPTKPSDDDICVYMERRSNVDMLGYTITGKFDFVAEGKVHDFKSTSVFGYINQTNASKYIQQLSIYRYLNQDIIHKDTATIHYIFTDWNKVDSLRREDYPKNRVVSQSYELMSIDDTEKFIKDKLIQMIELKDEREENLPYCTDEELWRKPSVWKYYKKPDAQRSTKNYDNPSEAYARANEEGGYVKEVKGQVSACKYCPAFLLCTQKDMLIANGDLDYEV